MHEHWRRYFEGIRGGSRRELVSEEDEEPLSEKVSVMLSDENFYTGEPEMVVLPLLDFGRNLVRVGDLWSVLMQKAAYGPAAGERDRMVARAPLCIARETFVEHFAREWKGDGGDDEDGFWVGGDEVLVSRVKSVMAGTS
ncbi:unnamed protein product [Fusarium langsethiae]|nr:unnamed protein product [Fusarium langsethiae]